jgi:hypothetical protein
MMRCQNRNGGETTTRNIDVHPAAQAQLQQMTARLQQMKRNGRPLSRCCNLAVPHACVLTA